MLIALLISENPNRKQLPRYKDFRGKITGALANVSQDHPLPDIPEEDDVVVVNKETETALNERLDAIMIEAAPTTRAQAIDSMLTDAAVHQLIMPEGLAEGMRSAHERALRQAIDIVVVKHLARLELQAGSEAADGDFAGFSKLFATCVVSNMGNIDTDTDTRSVNCCAICVEGGPVTRVENIMMHEIVSNVNVKGVRNLRMVVKTFTFDELKSQIDAHRGGAQPCGE